MMTSSSSATRRTDAVRTAGAEYAQKGLPRAKFLGFYGHPTDRRRESN